MRPDRYRVRAEADGTWTIADAFTDWPVGLSTECAQGLPENQARTMALFLNDLDRQRRAVMPKVRETLQRRRVTSIKTV